jgi:hypothetical protein
VEAPPARLDLYSRSAIGPEFDGNPGIGKDVRFLKWNIPIT